jgi:hypothetical protein
MKIPAKSPETKEEKKELLDILFSKPIEEITYEEAIDCLYYYYKDRNKEERDNLIFLSLGGLRKLIKEERAIRKKEEIESRKPTVSMLPHGYYNNFIWHEFEPDMVY